MRHRHKRCLRVFSAVLCAVLLTGLLPAGVLPAAEASAGAYAVERARTDGTFERLASFSAFAAARTEMQARANAASGALARRSFVVRRNSRVVAMSGGIAAVIRPGNTTLTFDNLHGGRRPYVVGRSVLHYEETVSMNEVWVRVSGVRARTAAANLLLIPAPFMTEFAAAGFRANRTFQINFYTRNALGNLSHTVTSKTNNGQISTAGPWAGTFVIGPAPRFMQDGVRYYSADGVNFFTDPFLTQRAGTHHPYFQFLSFRTRTNYTARQFDNYIAANLPADSVLRGQGAALIRAERDFGVNALLLLAFAIHESNRGTSTIARQRNNLFGIGAFDENPLGGAHHFRSVEECIRHMAERWLSRDYFNAVGDSRYFGTHMGNKHAGINVAYASDPYHGQKIAGHAFRIDLAMGGRDYGKYEIGITGRNTAVFATASGSRILYRKSNRQQHPLTGLPVIVLGRSGDRFRVQSDMPVVNNVVNNTARYRFSHVGFVNASQVTLLGTMRAPSRPGGVTAAARNTSSVRISWNQSIGAERYEVQRSRSRNSGFTTFATVTGTSAVHRNVTPGTVYHYRVRALRSVGGETRRSRFSRVAAGTARPRRAANAAATPTGFSTVTVTWDAVPGARGYQIQRSRRARGGFSTVSTINSGSTLSFTDTDRSADTTYRYRVRAFVSAGGERVAGRFSPIVSASPGDARPRNVRAASAGTSSVTLRWRRVGGASGYEILRSTRRGGGFERIATVGRRQRSFTDTGLELGRQYFYRVRATRTVNGQRVRGRRSATVSATPRSPAPANVTVTRRSDTSARVSWNRVPGASGYTIQRAASRNGRFRTVGTVTGRNTTAFRDRNLTPGTRYFYRVRAFRRHGGRDVNGDVSSVVAHRQ